MNSLNFKKNMSHFVPTYLPTKGHLISKELFGTYPQFSQFLQKTNKKIRPTYYGSSVRIIFVHFIEELKSLKRHFEMN